MAKGKRILTLTEEFCLVLLLYLYGLLKTFY